MFRSVLPLSAVVLVALTACGSDDDQLRDDIAAAVEADEATGEGVPVVPVEVSTDLVDPEGSVIGTAWFRDAENGAAVEVQVAGMTAGFHGMFLAEVGGCESDSAAPGDPAQAGSFPSAGAVVQELPALLVLEDGVGSATTLVGPVSLDELLAGDGTALVIADVADGTTDTEGAATGDTGSRTACAAVGEAT